MWTWAGRSLWSACPCTTPFRCRPLSRPQLPLPSAAVKPRLPQRAVLSHERHAAGDTVGHVKHYDATMQSFYASQGMPAVRWSDHSLARLRDPAQLRGRHRLVEALAAQRIGLR